MRSVSLQNSFKEFCKRNKLEINTQQKEIINFLDEFLNHKKMFLSSFFKKKNHFAFTYMEK